MTIQEQINEFKAAKERGIKSGLLSPMLLSFYEDKIAELGAELKKSEKTISEKKNESKPVLKNDAIAVVVEPQLSQPKPSVERESSNVDLESNTNSDSDSDLQKRIGIAHKSKFKSIDSYERYVKIYNRLRHKLRNWVKSVRKRSKVAKMNDVLDDAKEIERLIKNDALPKFKDELLNIEYSMSVTIKKTGEVKNFVFGIDPSVLKSFFRD